MSSRGSQWSWGRGTTQKHTPSHCWIVSGNFWGGHFPYTKAHHLGEFSQPAFRMVKAPSPHLKHLPWAHHRNTWNSQIFESPQPQTSACIKKKNLWSFVLDVLVRCKRKKWPKNLLPWCWIQRIRKKVTNSTNPSSVTTSGKQPFFTKSFSSNKVSGLLDSSDRLSQNQRKIHTERFKAPNQTLPLYPTFWGARPTRVSIQKLAVPRSWVRI